MTPDGDGMVDVRLLGFPLPLWQRAREHQEELLREFALVAVAHVERTEMASVPRRLLDLVDDLTERYADRSVQVDALRDEAIDRGAPDVDLVYPTPRSVAAVCRHLGTMLDEADEYCRAGDHLLTLAADPEVRRFREWYLSEFIRQIGGAPPTPWPAYAATARGEPDAAAN